MKRSNNCPASPVASAASPPRKNIDVQALLHIGDGLRNGREFVEILQEVAEQGYLRATKPTVASAYTPSTAAPRELDEEALGPLTNDMWNIQMVLHELDPKPPFTSSPRSPEAEERERDSNAIAHLVEFYQAGEYLDELVNEFFQRGYPRPSYKQLVQGFSHRGIKLSANSMRNEKNKRRLAKAIKAATRSTPASWSPPSSPRTTRKEFGPHAVKHLVEGYKNGGDIDVPVQELVDQGYRNEAERAAVARAVIDAGTPAVIISTSLLFLFTISISLLFIFTISGFSFL